MKSPITVSFLLTTAILAATASPAKAAAPQSPPSPSHAPNILFILADDLGYGEIGANGGGGGKILTPNIDALGKEGLRFTQAYAGAPVCAPSRCSLLTGLHTGHAFIRGNAKFSLRPTDTTLAEVLQKNGYATMSAGKWGLGEPDSTGTPFKKGFDYFYGFIDQTHAHNSWPSFLYRNEDKVELRNVVPNPGQYGQGVATVKLDFANDLFDDEILKFMDRTPDNKPFFIYAAFTAPHANNESHLCEVPDLGPYKDKDWPEPEKLKAALITRLDSYVGHLMKKLHDKHLDENTLVIFTSDNGPHEEGSNSAAFDTAAGPLRGIKRDVYEGGFREPFIARWTGRIQPDTSTDQVIAFWDFFPTAAEIAGIPPATLPKNLDGFSFLPTLLGHHDQQKQHDMLYWEFHERGFEQAALMIDPSGKGTWKALRHGTTQPVELYELHSDIAEKNNLAKDHPDLIAKFTQYFAASHVDSTEFPVKDATPRATGRSN
ncbi:MAG TPA: arylsulfatase [Phycisphaerae bacterium]